MNFKSLYKEYKENYLFWLMFVLFFFLWLVSTIIFTSICMIKGISITEGSLGAYANILVFDATIFAPIAAYFFYDNWKAQHNKTVISYEAKEVWSLLVELSIETLDLDYEYYNLYNKEYLYFYNQSKLNKEIEKLKQKTEKYMMRFYHFSELTENEDSMNLFMEFYAIFKDYKTYLDKIGDNDTVSDIEETESDFRERLCEANKNIRLYLKTFILA